MRKAKQRYFMKNDEWRKLLNMPLHMYVLARPPSSADALHSKEAAVLYPRPLSTNTGPIKPSFIGKQKKILLERRKYIDKTASKWGISEEKNINFESFVQRGLR